jgi:zona occludens toxin
MALKLVTAPPGTGKTLLLIKMIFEYLKQGRRVYSNIDQLKIEEVLPLPHNADWRDYPDGSVIIYDEAQEHAAFSSDDLIDFPEFIESEQFQNENITAYNARIRKEKKDYDRMYKRHVESIKDIARGFQTHRHFGFDIILATQDQSFLNNLAKKCVGEHYHLTRPFGLRGNMIFFWRRLVSNPDSRAEKSSCEWKKHINFNKNYFHLYRSANVHTHKSKIPLKYILFLIIMVILICIPFYLISNNKALSLMSGKKEETKQISTDIVVNQKAPSSPEALAAFNEEQRLQLEREKRLDEQRQIYAESQQKEQQQEISGCVYFNRKYTAVDEYARPIKNKSHLCKQVIQDADRNVMKKPVRQTSQQNSYSSEADQELEQARLIEKQKQVFDDNSDLYRVGGLPTN